MIRVRKMGAGHEEPPIRALIRVGLAARSDADPAADPYPKAWRFRPGGAGGWVLQEVGLRG